MTNESTSRLHPVRLARLLAIGEEDAALLPASRARLSAEACLLEWLSSVPPSDGRSRLQSVPAATERTVRDLLFDSKTECGVLIAVKEDAKRRTGRAAGQAERAAATAVYYAAIAAALLYHGRRITRHSYKSLSEGLAKLADKTWVPSDLCRLYGQARRACEDHGRKADVL